MASGLAPPAPVARTVVLSPWGLGLLVVACAVCWLLVEDRPAAASGLVLVTVALLLPGLAAWPALSSTLRTGLLAAEPLAVVGAVLVVGRWSHGLGRRRILPSPVLAGAAAIVLLLGYDPFADPACRTTCEAAPALLDAVVTSRTAVGLSALLLIVAGGTAMPVLLTRTAPLALRAASAALVCSVIGAAVARWWSWTTGGAPTVLDSLHVVATAAVVTAVAYDVLGTRLVRRRLQRVVADLSATPTDRRPDVHFALPEDGRFVGRDGLPVDEPPGRCAVVRDSSGPVARLVLGRGGSPGELEPLSRAAQLSLDVARLQATDLARLHELRASQRRIVEAADSERHRLERDLHDGAQQRLVAVAMHLSSAASQPGASELLHAAQAHVVDALRGLRELSHRSSAAVLHAEGLTAAVEDLVACTPIRVNLEMDVLRAIPLPSVELAAYAAIEAGLAGAARRGATSPVGLRVGVEGDELVVRVVDEGPAEASPDPALATVTDRVEACGGSLASSRPPGGGTTLEVRLPCG